MAKIYGTPIMAGGAGGANKDLPPLLDNFKAVTGEEENTILVSADKMLESRANELAGAVWVYGDHEPESVNDGTKIQLSREDIITFQIKPTPNSDGSYDMYEESSSVISTSDMDESYQVTRTIQWDGTKNFFARQFTFNSKKQYQTMREGAIAKVIPSQSITELPSGSKVKLGTWNDTPLQWKVARDTSDQSLRLVLEPTSVSLLGNKAYDAAEPSNSDSERKTDGNNRYIYSNIHQWLNATKASEWYTAQHSADAAPSYASSPGFLSGWSETDLSALDEATLTTTKVSIDGGGTETFVARVALISITELGLESGTGGGRLDIFNSDGDRAIGSFYWTRTPFYKSSIFVRSITGSGAVNNTYYARYARGVRPLCSPKSTTYVSLQPDSDGCYTITGVNE